MAKGREKQKKKKLCSWLFSFSNKLEATRHRQLSSLTGRAKHLILPIGRGSQPMEDFRSLYFLRSGYLGVDANGFFHGLFHACMQMEMEMEMKGRCCRVPHDPIVCARAEQDLVNFLVSSRCLLSLTLTLFCSMTASWLLRRWSPNPSPLLGPSPRNRSTRLLHCYSTATSLLPFARFSTCCHGLQDAGVSPLTPDGSCVRRIEID